MTDERIITACVVTSGEKSDGPVLEELYHKSKDNGVTIEAIVGDRAYSGKDNMQFTKKERVHWVARPYPTISKGFRRKEDEFFYNKDAGLFVCPEGHMALKKEKTGRRTAQETHYFDIKHCQIWAVIKKGLSLRLIWYPLRAMNIFSRRGFRKRPILKKRPNIATR